MWYKGDALLAALCVGRTVNASLGKRFGMPQMFGGGFTFERPSDYQPEGSPGDRSEPTPFQHVYDDGSGGDNGGNCGMMQGTNRIAGGWEEDIQNVPWAVFVQACNAAGFCAGCAGNIIAPEWVLTAAHCVKGAELTTGTIRSGIIFGMSDIQDFGPSTWRDWIDMAYHEDFNERFHINDIGAVKADSPFVKTGNNINFEKNGAWGGETQFVFPICLPVPTFCLQPYTNMYTVGWGYQSTKDSHKGENWNLDVAAMTSHEHDAIKDNGPSWDGPSTHIRGVYLPLIQLAKCRLYHDHREINPIASNSGPGGSVPCEDAGSMQDAYGRPNKNGCSWKRFKIDNNMVCAGNQLKSGVCHGDQGGPLMYRDGNEITTLYGMTSWGLGCARAGYPGVFARVSSYLGWIKNTTGAYMDTDPDANFDDSCRDWRNNLEHTTPRNPATASLTNDQNLIKSYGFFDNFCVRTQGDLEAIDARPKGNTYQLVLRDPNDCNPNWDSTQWEFVGDNIKSVAHSGAYCWDVKHTITSKKRRNEVKLKPCDDSAEQEFEWNSKSGKLYVKGNPNLIVRFRANMSPQLVEKRHIPMTYKFQKPEESNNYALKGMTYLENFCAVKKGNRHFRKKNPIWALRGMVNNRGKVKGDCDNPDGRGQWFWDERTMQIKNWMPNKKHPKYGRWCWMGNPRSKKKNYIRLRRCWDPKEYECTNEDDVNISPQNYIDPAVSYADHNPKRKKRSPRRNKNNKKNSDDEEDRNMASMMHNDAGCEYMGKRQYWTQFNWDPSTNMIEIARNPNLVIRMERNKRIGIVNKWKVGFTYGVGQAIPDCVAGFDAHNNNCDWESDPEADLCICPNGVAETDCPLKNVRNTVCTDCNDGYYLDGDQCREKTCVCTVGIAATGTDCPEHGALQCDSCPAGTVVDSNGNGDDCVCEDGFHQIEVPSGDICVRKECTCQRGTAASGTDCPNNGDEVCVSCMAGAHLSNGVCQCMAGYFQTANGNNCRENTCVCPLGTPATGVECGIHGDAVCTSCNNGADPIGDECTCAEGFFLDGDSCSEITCSCPLGTPATQNDCPTHGIPKCVSCGFNAMLMGEACMCNDGFYDAGTECALKECECDLGTGHTGTDCANNGDTSCFTCDAGAVLNGGACECNDAFFEDNGVCEEKACECDNGMAATGAACPADGDTACTMCSAGFFVDADLSCRENMCACAHGTMATGTDCPSHGDVFCMDCEDGYESAGNDCVQTIHTCTCEFGTEVTGAACLAEGQEQCESCDDGSDAVLYASGEAICTNAAQTIATALLVNFDANSDNMVNLAELTPVIISLYGATETSAIQAALTANDGNSDNMLNVSELTDLMNSETTDSCVHLCDSASIQTIDPTTSVGDLVNPLACDSMPCGMQAEMTCVNTAFTYDATAFLCECDPGFYLNGVDECLEKTCTCEFGTAATGTDCPFDGDAYCTECNSASYLDGNICFEKMCECENGNGAQGDECSGHGDDFCVSCSSGYYLYEENDECLENTCQCANGDGATNTDCAVNAEFTCAADGCDAGYHNEGITCEENVCICENGSPATISACPMHAMTHKCIDDCDDGYDFVNDLCVLRECQCNDGTPATGTDCPDSNDFKCVACDAGHTLDNGACPERTCLCTNGDGATGADCSTNSFDNDIEACTGCDAGFHLNPDDSFTTCVVNVCTCENGDAATGVECEPEGAKCVACDGGFVSDGAGACVSERTCTCDGGNPVEGIYCHEDGREQCELGTCEAGKAVLLTKYSAPCHDETDTLCDAIYDAFAGGSGLNLDQFKEAVKTLYGSTKNKHINNAYNAYATGQRQNARVTRSSWENLIENESNSCNYLCKSKGYRAFDCDTTIADAEDDPGLPCDQMNIDCGAGQVCFNTYYTYAMGGEQVACLDDPEN